MNNTADRATHPSWILDIDQDGVAWLAFNRADASANSLSRAALQELSERLAEIEQRRPKALVIFSAKKSGFIAGADIKEFTSLASADQAYELIRSGQKVLERLEALSCPTVAAIHGFALGGGLELALACRYRLAASDGRVSLGLPEVQLGIHPGFGGTVRLVRLIGPIAALDLILTGRSLRAEKALQLGVVDRLAPAAELRQAAKQLALAPPPPQQPGLEAALAGLGFVRPLVAEKVRRQLNAKRVSQKHYPAPYAVVDLWQRYGAKGEASYEGEARSIAQLFVTETSRNLVRVFLLQDRLKALGGKTDTKVSAVHVVGAGVMGGDIATWCATRGLQVSLQDRALEYIDPALERARAFVDKRYADVAEREQALARLVPDVEGEQAAQADVVIEAVFEDPTVKQALYARLEPRMKPGAILATNTSSLMLEGLAAGLQDPGRLVGLHFFNPVARMPLIEVIQGQDTRPEVLQAAMAFARQLDKLPLPCRSAPGFVVNRILMPYLNEAMLAVEQGVPPAIIDLTATDFGMPMGPIELADVVGLDVAQNVGRILAQAFSKPAPQSVQNMVSEKKLGKKTGQGFYRWVDGKPQKPPVSGAAPQDLEDRLILPMLNEAVAVLREGVAEDADLIDAGIIFGTGFAPFRGGPLQYARSRGVARVVERLEQLSRSYGPHFRPDAGWRLI